MKEVYSTYLQDAVAIRKHLHQIPELQYQEVETSAFIAKTLRSYGYQVQKNIGKTGVVAVLDTGYPGK
jgi:metal-dependent amidase/aminoacylase/carboxypeptidase family protein